MGKCLNTSFSSFEPVIRTIVENFCTHHLEKLAWMLTSSAHECLNSQFIEAQKCFEGFGNLFDHKSNPQKFQVINEILTTSMHCQEFSEAFKCYENAIENCTTTEFEVSRLVFKELTREAKCEENEALLSGTKGNFVGFSAVFIAFMVFVSIL